MRVVGWIIVIIGVVYLALFVAAPEIDNSPCPCMLGLTSGPLISGFSAAVLVGLGLVWQAARRRSA